MSDPIRETHLRFMEAFKNGDVATLVSIYSENAVMMPPNEPSIFGRKEIEEWHNEYFSAFRVVTVDETEREVNVLGDWAVERWAYLVAIKSVQGSDRIRDD